ncbi:MAG: recombinase family protein [Pseudonocardiaceae bacterium]
MLLKPLISDRTKDALAAARAKGVQLGRPTVVTEDIAREIMRLFKRRHMSARVIANHLTEQGIPTPLGGERWHVSTVARVIARNGGTLKRGRVPMKKRRKAASAR